MSENNNILITTGLFTNNIIDRLELNSTRQISKKIYINNIKENIILVKQPTYIDLESILRKTKTLITCHGSLTQAGASFGIKIVDIVQHSKKHLASRYTNYIKNYYVIYRDKFSLIKNKIINLI